MNGKDLLNGLNHIDERYIEEAERDTAPVKPAVTWRRWAALAACACLVLALSVMFRGQPGVAVPHVTVNDPTASATLPSQEKPGDTAVRLSAVNLMDGISPRPVTPLADMSAGDAAAVDFAASLLRGSTSDGENTLISPLSVMYALAMTANGAEGETLEEMEAVLGMSAEEWNLYLYSYMNSLPNTGLSSVKTANSIWFTNHERFHVDQNFLQTNADYYGADIFSASFDETTLADINSWVDENTDGMIPQILDEIPDNAVMYLINALTFEGQWSDVYDSDHVHSMIFTTADGTEQETDFLIGVDHHYLENARATGFMKYFAGGGYAFVAVLPNEGITLDEYVRSLTGEELRDLLMNVENVRVETRMPCFETEYETEMSDVLKSMGMELAFDAFAADFSGLGYSDAGNIFINRVIHKTFITVGPNGAKAGAATVVEAVDEFAMEPVDTKVVDLDRPFLYLIIDTASGLPLFVGTMQDVN